MSPGAGGARTTVALVVSLLVAALLVIGCARKKNDVAPDGSVVAAHGQTNAPGRDDALPPASSGRDASALSSGAPASSDGSPPGASSTAAQAGADPNSVALIERTRATLADLQTMVDHGTLTHPQKPEDGDIVTKCAAISEARPVLARMVDDAVPSLLDECHRMCSIEVPLVSARHALRQAGLSASQASRRLMCDLASKDLAKVRATKPTDRRVRELSTRYAQACR